jgi:hypothetical protein
MDVVACRKCGTAHHRECWRYNRGCSVFGCGCRTFQEPEAAPGSGDPFTARQPLSVLGFLALLLTTIGSSLGVAMVALVGHKVLGWSGTAAGVGGALIGVPLYLGLLLATIHYFVHGHRRLTFDPASGAVTRQLFRWGREWGVPQQGWLRAGDVVEVHVHRFSHHKRGALVSVWVALADGSRLRIEESGRGSQRGPEELEALAERVAAFADTTVRMIDGREAPPPDEIRALAGERRRELLPPVTSADPGSPSRSRP